MVKLQFSNSNAPARRRAGQAVDACSLVFPWGLEIGIWSLAICPENRALSHSQRSPYEFDRCFHTRHRIIRLGLVFESHMVRIFYPNQRLEHSGNVDDAFANLDCRAFLIGRGDIFHVKIMKPAATFLDCCYRVLANATLRPRIEAVCRQMGYEPPVICTPMELPGEGDGS